MRVTASTLSLTVADVDSSSDFFCTHLGYRVAMADTGFVSLTREDAADLVLLRRGTEVLPPEQRDQQAAGLILALTVTGIEDEDRRLRAAGAPITMPLREEPWGERLFQLTDPNGVVVQLVQWATPEASPRPSIHVISPTDENVTESPGARMTGLAAPSRGSTELSTWTVVMKAGQSGPEHAISREQVWTVTAGALEVTCDGSTEKVMAGQTFILPPGAVRRINAPQAAEALVAMRSDGVASVPGTEDTRALPWAQ
ncbi:cupin domain-containing protein [Streptomyces sp. YC504]|uniref:Cupin domain-containing protein n=1 Tax=Streptomyces mesophilus TaxID=1775132 RepID=A0A6G4XJ64_9ACTN|nr:VOC family protein [Streptomyces mesophilus]NGO77222.1 cupin domain-containing protein [Streptomyces mesophilus]